MNTFKKLIFGLLLSGMALTVGCNDDKKQVEEGNDCTKEDICKGDLKCVLTNKGDDKGKCAKVCTKPADCTGGKTCDKTVSVADGSEAKQCKAGGGGVVTGTQELGTECDANNTTDAAQMCKPGLKCHDSKCYASCDVPGDCAGKKAGDDTSKDAPSCSADKVCVQAAAPEGLGEGESGCLADGSDPAKACQANLTCVTFSGTDYCMKECSQKGANQDGCSDSTLGPNCIEGPVKKADSTTKVNVCYKGMAAHGAECDSTSGDPTKLCVKTEVCNPTENKCLVSCTAAKNGSEECTAAKTADGSADALNCTDDNGVLSCTA